MGATVLLEQAATTLRHANGTLIYFLFERTHEAITSATECHWNCIAMGTYVQVLSKIFQHAGACETGSLIAQSGPLAPEDYLNGWRQAMRNPAQQGQAIIDLNIVPSMYGGVPPQHVDEVANLIAGAGQKALAVSLTHGSAQIDLYEQLDLVLAVFGNQGLLPPWRALHYDAALPKGESDTPESTGKQRELHLPMVYRIGATERLVKVGSGPWERWGWERATVGRFIASEARQMELDYPGSAVEAIAAFRTLCALAEELPAGTSITVQRSVPQLPAWYEHSADNLAQQLGIAMDDEQAPQEYAFDYAQAVKHDGLYYLCSLSPLQVQWNVPAAQSQGQTNGNGHGNGGAPFSH